MIRAIKERNFDIHNRETRQYTIWQRFLQTLLYSRNKFSWNYTTLNFIDKLKSFTRFIRLHFQPHMPILATPA